MKMEFTFNDEVVIETGKGFVLLYANGKCVRFDTKDTAVSDSTLLFLDENGIRSTIADNKVYNVRMLGEDDGYHARLDAACKATGMSYEKLQEIGLEVLKCTCSGAGCPGWTLRKNESFSIDQFHAQLIGG